MGELNLIYNLMDLLISKEHLKGMERLEADPKSCIIVGNRNGTYSTHRILPENTPWDKSLIQGILAQITNTDDTDNMPSEISQETFDELSKIHIWTHIEHMEKITWSRDVHLMITEPEDGHKYHEEPVTALYRPHQYHRYMAICCAVNDCRNLPMQHPILYEILQQCDTMGHTKAPMAICASKNRIDLYIGYNAATEAKKKYTMYTQ